MSARHWAWRWAASGRCVPAAWAGCAVRSIWSPSSPTRPRTSRSWSRGVSIVARGWDDDDTLLAALKEAVRARRAVPPEFVEAGKNAFAWHNIDAELAQLTYDSTRASQLEARTRSESASIRALTFTSALISNETAITEN